MPKYCVKVYKEMSVEVEVEVPKGWTSVEIGDLACQRAEMIPNLSWQEVPDSIDCDRSSDIQLIK